MSGAKDLTRGKPLVLILQFALPMMLGSVFQQLYTVTDAAIVGRFVGVKALAAVGAADWFNWLVLGIMIGFAQGFAIIPAQRFGARDMAGLKKAAATGIIMAFALGLLLTAAALPLVSPVLRLLNTESIILGQAKTYLYILFSGIVVVAGYNIFASLLRALGNSRDPLIAMVIGSCVNIVLDLLFVIVFHWGVAGAAVATVLGQGCAMVYCLCRIRRESAMAFHRSDWQPDRELMLRELKLGLPMAMQNAVIGVGGMALQQVANGFRYVFVAGYTATNKLYGVLELAAINFGYAMASYSGQNLGANRFDRIKRGLRSASALALVTSLAVGGIMILFGRQVVSIFISAEDPLLAAEATGYAYEYLVVMCLPLFVLYFLHVYRSALQGMGDTVMPFLSGMLELVMRLGIVYTFSGLLGYRSIFIAEPLAWLGADLVLIPACLRRVRLLQRRLREVDE